MKTHLKLLEGVHLTQRQKQVIKHGLENGWQLNQLWASPRITFKLLEILGNGQYLVGEITNDRDIMNRPLIRKYKVQLITS